MSSVGKGSNAVLHWVVAVLDDGMFRDVVGEDSSMFSKRDWGEVDAGWDRGGIV